MPTLYKINSAVEPDAKDAAIAAEKEATWNKRKGPRVGDFVLIGDRAGRFSHAWNDGIQWSEGGSFYHHGEGASFSGSLNAAIPYENLTETDETREGNFWFFHHGFSGASRGVGCRMACRVFRAKTSLFDVTTDNTTRRIVALDRSDAWSEGVRQERKANGRGDCWYPQASVEVQAVEG